MNMDAKRFGGRTYMRVRLMALLATIGALAAPAWGQSQPAPRERRTPPAPPAKPAAPPQPADETTDAESAGRDAAQPAPARPGAAQPGDQPAGEPAVVPPAAADRTGARTTVARKPDRVNELVKSLDPAVINRLLGAEVQVEYVGGKVILKGPEEAVKTIELLIKALDQEIEQKELRVIQVKERDAKEIARTVQEALRDATRFPNQRDEEQITLTALTPTILLVGALPKDIDFVLHVIEEVDAVPDPMGRVDLMTFEVKNRKATDVAKELVKVLEQFEKSRGIPKDKTRLQIIPNNANNTITVTARENEREKIQSLIDQIDVKPSAGWGETKLTVFPLLHSKAKDLGEVVKTLLTSQAKADKEALDETIFRLRISKALPGGKIEELPPIDLQKPLKITPDDGSNSLIIATVEENVGPIGELIRLLDGVPLGEAMAVKLFPLRFADAEKAADMLKKMFEEGKKLPEDPDGSAKDAVPEGLPGKALVYNIGVSADLRTNTLVVTGRPEQLDLAETIVRQLDTPANALKFPLRLIPLEYADATRVGELINKLLEKRMEAVEKTDPGKSAAERERVFLSVDIPSNTLLVSASDENFHEIVTITGQLDTRPAQAFEQIRLVPCRRLSVAELKKKIDDLWKRKADLRKTQELSEDAPIIAADERSNVLIVASSPEDFEEIKRLVEALESQPLIDDTQLFKLAYADATVLAGMLEKLFEGLASASETFKTPTLLPDLRSNSLVVAGSREALERVEELIGRLDIPGGPQSAMIRVYPLTNGSASKLAPRMQKLFEARAQEQDVKATPVVIFAEEGSNSLVCSASRDDHDVVLDLIGVLDRPSSIARQFEIFPLKLAKAAKVAEKLDELFKTQAEGESARADAIAVQADERTNALIVWASPTEMVNIGEVIARLDTASPAVEMMVKVIQLKQALAEDFAKLLDETLVGEESGTDEGRAVIVSFLDKDAQGKEVVRKLLRQDIKIKPDPRTNSVMVMAPADSITMLEAMIRDFDRVRPIRSEIRLFPLLNGDAETMVQKLTDLFQGEAGGGGGAEGETRRQFSFGEAISAEDFASVGQELRFTADTRTNTIIAAGAEVDLRMVDELIRYLDSQEAEDRVVGVYQTKYRPAPDLANAVKAFVEQEQQVLGDGEDEESKLKKRERQVSVESLGDEEKGSSSLIYGTSRRGYQRTMDMIEQLDRPEPQVMISVLIAEVTLSDDVELGIEIAGQDLDFADSAIEGPNGVVQGSDFDFVGGTDVGAAGTGLGGFNFTITGEDFSFLLHALETDSRLEIMSRPILMVRNGEEGKITIADEVPIVESSQITDTGQTRSNIGREEVGIILTATPHISPDGYVTIELTQEISNISGENIQLTEGVSSPVFSKREVDTNVTVRDGETVVIGGLIQSRDSEGENKVPILGDIPGLGAFFRSTRVSHRKTELLVVLTVDILRTDEDMYRMSTEQRDKFELPPSILQHPFMGGLRIMPQEAGMGPQPATPATPAAGKAPAPAPGPARREERDLYGPKPRTYGPVISRPASTTAEQPVYGPPIVRNETKNSG
ncbi:MAG: hypothetical protein HY763_15615 [Planctomycetes bacterium]|nr:hypothetical protein [Planctomycetota bacterium]